MGKDIWGDENLVDTLRENGVVVMPTDTIYGIVGRALSPSTVERIYGIRKRAPEKPCIILIGDISELAKFSINLSEWQQEKLSEFWPGPVSIIFDCPFEKFTYLHRGTKTLAFRLPNKEGLRDLLLKTGPLIAPSANTEKFPESETAQDAESYFGNKVDLYIDGGPIRAKASKLIKLHKDGSVSILRE